MNINATHFATARLPLCIVVVAILRLTTFVVFADEAIKQPSSQDGKPLLLSKALADASIENDRTSVTFLRPIEGQLAYTFTAGRNNVNTFLALRSSSDYKDTGIANQGESGILYRGTKWIPYHEQDIIFDPLFSPDGRYILFKFGEPWNIENRYLLYVLDTKTNNLYSRLSGSLAYDFVSWSPDGNYIAFIQGGDRDGNTTVLFDQYIGPLKLSVWNWRTGKEQVIVENDSVRGSFSWSFPHNIFYSVLPTVSLPQNGTKPSSVNRPNIYQHSVETGRSVPLFKDGYLPTLSPNGQLIAFFGSQTPSTPEPLQSNWQYSAPGMTLIVAKKDGTERIALDQMSGSYPAIVWAPDNVHLFTIERIADSPNSVAEIKEWDIRTKLFRRVGTLTAKDYKLIRMPVTSPTFRPVGVSNDGQSLLIWVREWVEEGKNNSSVGTLTLQSVNIQDGTIDSIIRVKKAGVAWHEANVDVPR